MTLLSPLSYREQTVDEFQIPNLSICSDCSCLFICIYQSSVVMNQTAGSVIILFAAFYRRNILIFSCWTVDINLGQWII